MKKTSTISIHHRHHHHTGVIHLQEHQTTTKIAITIINPAMVIYIWYLQPGAASFFSFAVMRWLVLTSASRRALSSGGMNSSSLLNLLVGPARKRRWGFRFTVKSVRILKFRSIRIRKPYYGEKWWCGTCIIASHHRRKTLLGLTTLLSLWSAARFPDVDGEWHRRLEWDYAACDRGEWRPYFLASTVGSSSTGDIDVLRACPLVFSNSFIQMFLTTVLWASWIFSIWS